MNLNGSAVTPGVYGLILQSFDANSGGVNSTLMTDTVQVTVESAPEVPV